MIITKKEEILFYSLIQTPSMTPIIPKTTLILIIEGFHY